MSLRYLTRLTKSIGLIGFLLLFLATLGGLSESPTEDRWLGYLMLGGAGIAVLLFARLRVRLINQPGEAPHLKIRSWFRSYSIPITEQTTVTTDVYDGWMMQSNSSFWTVIEIEDEEQSWVLNMTLNYNSKTRRNSIRLQELIDSVRGRTARTAGPGGKYKAK